MQWKRRSALLVAVTLALGLLASAAQAKDFKTMPSVEAGGRWFFAYHEGAKEVSILPAAAYGVTFTQIIDFSWARNIAFDVNYLHSRSHGELADAESDDIRVFDLTADTVCGNIGYFFSGRKLLPYISGGFGMAALKYEPESTKDKLWEQDFMLNLGGGMDYTLWEAEKSRALDRVLLGARVRYEYIFVQKIVDASLNDLSITARFELRF